MMNGKLDMIQLIKKTDQCLSFAGFSISKLAEKYDTPLYVISELKIIDNYNRMYEALTKEYNKIRIYYSAKANTNLSVLKTLEREGAYLDAVSPGEVFLAKKAGFLSNRILFTGTSVRNDELRYLLESNVTINIDSLSQLNWLLKITVPNQLSFRINPELGAGHHESCITAGKEAKFGLWEDEVVKGYQKAKNTGVKNFGIHMHIGSGIMSVEPYLIATQRLLKIAKKVREKTKIKFQFINIGGGMGIPYKPDEAPFDTERFAQEICGLYKRKIKEYQLNTPVLCVEPGRYIVGEACALITRVNTIKQTPYKMFIGVDAGFNTLIRPTMYDAYHHILVSTANTSEERVCDVAGPICESGDLLAENRKLPYVKEGDLLVVLNTGAYGYSMSSQYNSRPRAAEVLVKEHKHVLVRKRETFKDLIRGQRIAKWLK